MRSAIRTIPDGCHRAAPETDGFDEPLRIELALTIVGERAEFDFTGTSPQVDHAINFPLCCTEAMSAYAIKCLAAPEAGRRGDLANPRRRRPRPLRPSATRMLRPSVAASATSDS